VSDTTGIVEAIRSQFPALAGPTVFLDNAGGSQLPRCVIDAVRRYMEESYVQLGADYDASRRATATIARARDVARCYLNGDGVGEVIFGSSTTVLCYELAAAYADARPAGRDQIIVCTAGHEANVGPWMRLAARGLKVLPWQAEPVLDKASGETLWRPSLDTLRAMLSDRTLLVLIPQVSNILGEVWDMRAVADAAHGVGARVLVDGVAYAPHRAPDVKAMECDWYVYSIYKVFGLHSAALFGTKEAMGELVGPNHYFIDAAAGPHKWELGGANHEACAGVCALWEYMCLLCGLDGAPTLARDPMSRAGFERAFGLVQRLEEDLQARFMEYLRAKPGVRIIGPRASDSTRVSTISFLSERSRPREISRHLGEKNMGIRWGHAYSKRLCEAMGLHPDEGVARVSLLHYNSAQEVDRLCAALDEVL